jgi:hypothetical protein
MSTYIVASLPLPLYCGILLLAKQHETKLVSLYCSLVTSCDFYVDLYSGILAPPIILWDLAAGKAAWDQTCLIILLISEQLRLPCRLIEWHPCHSHYAVGSCCWQSSMRPNLSQYYTAHRWAVLILYCSSLSSCDFHAGLYSGILATCRVIAGLL